MRFKNRNQAAARLAAKLEKYKKNCVVLAIPRGGIPVGNIISEYLQVPFHVTLVEKIPHPHERGLAIGAVTEFGDIFLSRLGHAISPEYIRATSRSIIDSLWERRKKFNECSPMPSIKNKVVVLVDDGIATGVTMEAAIHAIREQGCSKVVVASIVASPVSVEKLQRVVDELIVVNIPAHFQSIAEYFEDFTPVTDEAIFDILKVS